MGECSQQTADDHQDVEKQRDKDLRERHARHEKQAEQEERSGQSPVDVAGVPDLASGIAVNATTAGTVAQELNGDGSGAEIASLRVPRDGRDGEDCNQQVVESPSVSVHEARPYEEAQSASCHDTIDGPAPVTAPSSQMNVGVGWIEAQGSIASTLDEVHRRRHSDSIGILLDVKCSRVF